MTDRISSAEYRQRLGLGPAGQGGVTPKSAGKPQIRLSKPRKMTKVEMEWMTLTMSRYTADMFTVLYEPFTLKLPSGTRYTPDVVVVRKSTGAVDKIYEVKGPHIHSSASIRAFKEARSAFPYWMFVFVQKTKDGWTNTPE